MSTYKQKKKIETAKMHNRWPQPLINNQTNNQMKLC